MIPQAGKLTFNSTPCTCAKYLVHYTLFPRSCAVVLTGERIEERASVVVIVIWPKIPACGAEHRS